MFEKKASVKTFSSYIKQNYERRVGPSNVIALWRTDDADYGGEIASYYAGVRGIQNVIEVDIPITDPPSIEDVEIVRAAVIAASQDKQIHAIVMCGDWPKRNHIATAGWCFDDYLRNLHNPITDAPFLYVPSANWLRMFRFDRRAGRPGSHSLSDNRGTYEDENFYKTPLWTASRAVVVGDIIRHSESLETFASLFICDVNGTTGVTEPSLTPSGSDPDPYYDDGTARWRQYNINKVLYDPNISPSGLCRLPLNYAQEIINYSDKNASDITKVLYALRTEPILEFVDMSDNKDVMIQYVVTRLNAPAVQASDAYTTRLELAKDIIDRGIAFENAEHATVPGTHLLGGDSGAVDGCSVSALYDLQKNHENIVDQNNIFWRNMLAESAYAPYYATAVDNNYQAGDNYIQPKIGSTFTPVSDVFFHFLGVDTYFNSDRLPWASTEISYIPGAIATFGRSCGMAKTFGTELDFHTTQQITTTRNPTITLLPSAGDTASIYYGNVESTDTEGYRLSCSLDNASVIVSQTDRVVVNDTTNGTTNIDVPSGTPAEHYQYILSNMPAEWSITITCTGPESRCAYALRHGAAVAIGSLLEPLAPNSPSAHNIVDSFLHGNNLCETLRLYTSYLEIKNHGTSSLDCYGVVGDPLYRPFGHIELARQQ